MDTQRKDAIKQIKTLLNAEHLSVLATQENGQPYASLVAFAATHDLQQILFLTSKATRKYANLTAEPRAALLIHNSRNRPEDFEAATALTATGTTLALKGKERDALLRLFLQRNPELDIFSKEPGTAVISMAVDQYTLVSRFQDVIHVRMGS